MKKGICGSSSAYENQGFNTEPDGTITIGEDKTKQEDVKKCPDCMAYYTGDHTCPPWLKAIVKMKETEDKTKPEEMNPVQKAWTEATEAEKRFNDNITPEMGKVIEQELYSAATCWAMRNPKWKSDGFVEYLVNWFKN